MLSSLLLNVSPSQFHFLLLCWYSTGCWSLPLLSIALYSAWPVHVYIRHNELLMKTCNLSIFIYVIVQDPDSDIKIVVTLEMNIIKCDNITMATTPKKAHSHYGITLFNTSRLIHILLISKNLPFHSVSKSQSCLTVNTGSFLVPRESLCF